MKASRWFAVAAFCCISLGCVAGGSVNERPPSSQDAAVANLNLGAGYLRQGRADLALEALQRALDLNPRLADAHSTIAIAYDQLGKLEEAEIHYQRATALDSDNGSAANSYAVFLCRQNRWTDAESHFRRAANNPRYATPEAALANAGLCARNAGDAMKAEEYFRAALEKNPAFPDALSNMLDLSYRERNFLQARAFLQRYLGVRPATAAMLLMCVNIEQELDNRPAAERCAAQLREGFPDSAETAQLRELLGRNGRQ